ncbi:hypothetical protein ES705_44192 [subsurface metagenome]
MDNIISEGNLLFNSKYCSNLLIANLINASIFRFLPFLIFIFSTFTLRKFLNSSVFLIFALPSPSTNIFIVSSGNLYICTILAIVPIEYTSSNFGFSTSGSL